MAPAERGWWEADVEGAGPGSRYGFALDGGEPRPDPRSASQPDGVLGLSQVVDQSAFHWRDERWRAAPLYGSILYELHIGTFSPEGTFDGAIARLPHLVALGVDAVEIMPVAEFSGDRGWGYDCVDLFAPHHAYGGPDGLKRLVDACHRAGLAVLLDVVYNHLGPVGNFLAEYGPYFTERHRTPWGAAVNFEGPGSDEVRRLVIDNALMWIRDYHVDGLRLDAVQIIVDQSPTHILEQLATEVAALAESTHRPAYLIAETDLNDPRVVRSRDAGGYALDAAYSDDWHHALHAALTGERIGYYQDFGSLTVLAKALRQAWVYDGEWSPFRRRTRGRRAPDLPAHTFVVFAQNHDQVGNRASGDRLSMLVDRKRLRIAAALLLTTPFTPMLFQGEEWAASTPFQYFTDHRDPGLGKAVAEGRRREFAAFGWTPETVPDPQDAGTFERSRLRWEEIDEPAHGEMLMWYRDLIALRRRLPPASREDVRALAEDRRGTVRFMRPGLDVSVNLRDGSCAVRESGTSIV
jgi:maltooligosyltrehalose trehalohydrolase